LQKLTLDLEANYIVYIQITDSNISFPTCIPDGHPHRVTYARCCIDKIDSPDDEHSVALNM
jgi:hypothetical protein